MVGSLTTTTGKVSSSPQQPKRQSPNLDGNWFIRKESKFVMRYGIECKIRDTTSFFTSWVDAESSSEALAKFKQGKVYREQSSKLDIIRVVEMQSK